MSHRQCPVEWCCRDEAAGEMRWRVSEWGQQERLFPLTPLLKGDFFLPTGPSSLLSSPNVEMTGSVFQPVNTIFSIHPGGRALGELLLWRSLELIILYFILLYKQHSVAKEHTTKKPLWGWWWWGGGWPKARRKLTCSECCRTDRSPLSSLPSQKMKFTLTTFLLSFSFGYSSARVSRTPGTRVIKAQSPLCCFSCSARHAASQALARGCPPRRPSFPRTQRAELIGVRAKASMADFCLF